MNKSDYIALGALAVSILSFGASIIAINISSDAVSQTKLMYDETTRPHAESEELHDRLEALNNRIDRVEEWMKGKEENEDYSHWLEILNGATAAREEAWIQWDSYNFSKAEDNKTIANNLLNQIPMTTKPTSGELPICCLISVIIVVIIIVILFFFDRGKIFNR